MYVDIGAYSHTAQPHVIMNIVMNALMKLDCTGSCTTQGLLMGSHLGRVSLAGL